MALIGVSIKRDLSGMAKFLMAALIGIIVASLINIFFASSMMSFVISIVSILIFSGLIAYDNQLIKRFTTVPMVKSQMDGQFLWHLVFTWISLTYS